MASLLTNSGLEQSGKRIAGIAPTTHIQSMSWDNATGAARAFAAGDAALNTGGVVVAAFSPTSNTTVGSQTIQFEATLTTAQFNGNNIGRIALHFAATAAATTATSFLYGGIDQQTIQKTSEFSLITLLQITYSSTS